MTILPIFNPSPIPRIASNPYILPSTCTGNVVINAVPTVCRTHPSASKKIGGIFSFDADMLAKAVLSGIERMKGSMRRPEERDERELTIWNRCGIWIMVTKSGSPESKSTLKFG